MKKIWQIPYSDKRDRCAACLKVFRTFHIKYNNREYTGQRFTNICNKCRIK